MLKHDAVVVRGHIRCRGHVAIAALLASTACNDRGSNDRAEVPDGGAATAQVPVEPIAPRLFVLDEIRERVAITYDQWFEALSPEDQRSEEEFQRNARVAPREVEFVWSPWGTLSALTSHRMRIPAVGAAPGATSEERAAALLTELGPLLGLSVPGASMRLADVARDEWGDTVRFEQVVGDAAVLGAAAVIAVDADGYITFVRTSVVPEVALPVATSPLVPIAEAIAIASEFGEIDPLHGADLAIWHPLLSGSGAPDRRADLVWRVVTTDYDVLVDASSGTVLESLPRSAHDQHREVFEGTPGLSLVLDDECHATNSSCAGGPDNTCLTTASCPGDCIDPSRGTNADLVYDGLGVFYSYFSNRHSRDSWDRGLRCHRLRARWYNTTTGACAASWSPSAEDIYLEQQMYCSDVIVHEYTHGIDYNERPSAPLYSGSNNTQGKALSEAIPDIFGELAEKYSTGTTDWIHTDGCGVANPDCRRRSNFADPPSFENLWWSAGDGCGPGADTFSNYCTSTQADYSNLNIPGKAAYLAAREPSEGAATHYQVTTTGIGEQSFGNLLYYCFNSVLTRTDLFTTYATCLHNRSCATQSSSQCQEVINAHDAVSIWRPYRTFAAATGEVGLAKHTVYPCQTCAISNRRYVFYRPTGTNAIYYRYKECALDSSTCGWSALYNLSVPMTTPPSSTTQVSGLLATTTAWICGPTYDGGSPGYPVRCRRIKSDNTVDYAPDPGGTRTDARVSIAWHSGYLYVVRKAAGSGSQALKWTRYNPSSNTWSTEANVGASTAHAPTIASDGSATNGLWLVYRRASDGRIVYRKFDAASTTWSSEMLAGRSTETPATATSLAAAVHKSRLHVASRDTTTGEIRYMSCAQPCTSQSDWTRWVVQNGLTFTPLYLGNVDGILSLWHGDPIETGYIQWNFKVSE